ADPGDRLCSAPRLVGIRITGEGEETHQASRLTGAPARKSGRTRRSGRFRYSGCWCYGLLVAARQLLAKCGECLVVGKGACARGVAGERGAGGSRNVLDDLRCRCRNLLLVGLPASLGRSVVLLPLLALGLDAFAPLVGLLVEASEVLDAALLVVVGVH